MIHQRPANALSAPAWGDEDSAHLVPYQCDESNHPPLLLENPRLGDREVLLDDVSSFLVQETASQEGMSHLRGVIPDVQ